MASASLSNLWCSAAQEHAQLGVAPVPTRRNADLTAISRRSAVDVDVSGVSALVGRRAPVIAGLSPAGETGDIARGWSPLILDADRSEVHPDTASIGGTPLP